MDRYAFLEAAGLVTIAGEDRVSFLQGLVSNDVAKVSPPGRSTRPSSPRRAGSCTTSS